MEHEKIRRGDIVALNSHPHIPMTVYNTRSFVTCHWFAKDKTLQKHEFLAAQLTPYKPGFKMTIKGKPEKQLPRG